MYFFLLLCLPKALRYHLAVYKRVCMVGNASISANMRIRGFTRIQVCCVRKGFRVVQGEAKTPKIVGCCRASFAFLHPLKIGSFRGKWTLEWVIKTSHFVLLALYFLITSKLAFSLIASQRCLARTAKNVWVRAQNSAKNSFLPLRLETYLAWTFVFLRSFLNNYPWTSEKNLSFNKLWV